MSKTRCYKHEHRTLMAYCAGCGVPCCQDCVLEIDGDYYCERCRDQIASDIYRARVLPEAQRAVLIATLGLVFGLRFVGLAVGAYAISRAWNASKRLDGVPWVRGRGLVRATYALGACAIAIGVITWIQ